MPVRARWRARVIGLLVRDVVADAPRGDAGQQRLMFSTEPPAGTIRSPIGSARTRTVGGWASELGRHFRERLGGDR